MKPGRLVVTDQGLFAVDDEGYEIKLRTTSYDLTLDTKDFTRAEVKIVTVEGNLSFMAHEMFGFANSQPEGEAVSVELRIDPVAHKSSLKVNGENISARLVEVTTRVDPKGNGDIYRVWIEQFNNKHPEPNARVWEGLVTPKED